MLPKPALKDQKAAPAVPSGRCAAGRSGKGRGAWALPGDSRPQVAATLNGTLATTRWIVAILENHQQSEGSLQVPAALRPYLGGREALDVT